MIEISLITSEQMTAEQRRREIALRVHTGSVGFV